MNLTEAEEHKSFSHKKRLRRLHVITKRTHANTWELYPSWVLRESLLVFKVTTRNFLGLNPKGPYLGLEKEKENFCVVLTYFEKRLRKIRKFHVAIMQGRQKSVQKIVTHVHSCCFRI